MLSLYVSLAFKHSLPYGRWGNIDKGQYVPSQTVVGLLGGKPLRHMKGASQGRQPVSPSLSLSEGRAPNRHKADYNSSQSRQHFNAASAQFKGNFREALFEDRTDMKNFFNHMAFSVRV